MTNRLTKSKLKVKNKTIQCFKHWNLNEISYFKVTVLDGIKAFYLKPLTIFTKISVLGVQLVSEYAPDIATTIPFLKNVLFKHKKNHPLEISGCRL